MNFFLDAVRILNGEEAAHKFTDDNGRGLKNLLFRRIVGRDAEVGTELVGNGTADFITGNLTNHIETSKRE